MERLSRSWKWRFEVLREWSGLTWGSVSPRLGGEMEVRTLQRFLGIKCQNSLYKTSLPKPPSPQAAVPVAPELTFYLIHREPCTGPRTVTAAECLASRGWHLLAPRGSTLRYQPLFISHMNPSSACEKWLERTKEPKSTNSKAEGSA